MFISSLWTILTNSHLPKFNLDFTSSFLRGESKDIQIRGIGIFLGFPPVPKNRFKGCFKDHLYKGDLWNFGKYLETWHGYTIYIILYIYIIIFIYVSYIYVCVNCIFHTEPCLQKRDPESMILRQYHLVIWHSNIVMEHHIYIWQMTMLRCEITSSLPFDIVMYMLCLLNMAMLNYQRVLAMDQMIKTSLIGDEPPVARINQF